MVSLTLSASTSSRSAYRRRGPSTASSRNWGELALYGAVLLSLAWGLECHLEPRRRIVYGGPAHAAMDGVLGRRPPAPSGNAVAWSPAPSRCYDITGFRALDQYPIRSPLVVADFLLEHAAGRRFCELGTRNGDILSCVAHGGAASTMSVEMDEAYCTKLRERGLNVLCEAVEKVPDETLAQCDVTFWFANADLQNEPWLRQVLAAHAKGGGAGGGGGDYNASIFVAYDGHMHEDITAHLPRLAERYRGTVSRVFFDEGGDVFSGPEEGPSYATPLYGRPGQWGIMHMLEFQAGLGHAPPPMPGGRTIEEERAHEKEMMRRSRG